MSDGFKSIREFYDSIRRGGEVEFKYLGRSYSITHSLDGIHVMESYNYDSLFICRDVKTIGEYVIEGKILEDIITEIEITFRCL